MESETKQTTREDTMTTDQKFFYANAGYSVAQGETKEQGRRRTARELAAAESFARNAGWVYEWREDESSCTGCDCDSADCKCSTGEPHETLCCILRDNEEILASLGGICEATREYGRVIEAELARSAERWRHAVSEQHAR